LPFSFVRCLPFRIDNKLFFLSSLLRQNRFDFFLRVLSHLLKIKVCFVSNLRAALNLSGECSSQIL
jgi:hypothetical protein